MNQNSKQLFIASCMALTATAMTFAIRANILGDLGMQFKIPPKEMGIVYGTAFWGFTLSIILGGLICDLIGMKKLLTFSFIGHVTGIFLTLFATDFWSLFFSTLLIGIANGFVEAACNPLISSIYPNEKTKKLNQFHFWFPGGIVIGGLTAYFLSKQGLNWQYQTATILIPTLAYGFMFFNKKFPETERVSSGVTTSEMFEECKRPLFIFMAFCMLLTAATELGTNQWLPLLLENVGVSSILILVFINGLMAIGRSFAGGIEHKLSPAGMLLFSAVFSTIGLFLLSVLSGYWMFGAATIFAIGICYFWPTMLGFVSEYLPKTGAVGLSLVGAAGMLSVSIILPYIGELYEIQTQLNIPDGYPKSQEQEILKNAKLAGGAITLRYISLLPLLLTVAFTLLYLYIKKSKSKKQLI